jgi:F-type H+-transporting ATPase subunit b
MLVSINPGLIIWTIVTFLVLVFVLGKFGWGPIIRALEGREQGIRDALGEAEKARAEAQALRDQYDGLIGRAETESREIIQAGRETAEQLRREADVAAREEAQHLLDQARRDIQHAKEAALREIRDTVANLAVEAAGKIVQETLDADRHRKLVDDLIDRLPETRRN